MSVFLQYLGTVYSSCLFAYNLTMFQEFIGRWDCSKTVSHDTTTIFRLGMNNKAISAELDNVTLILLESFLCGMSRSALSEFVDRGAVQGATSAFVWDAPS